MFIDMKIIIMYCEVQILFLKYCLLRSAIREVWMNIRKKWQVHIMLYIYIYIVCIIYTYI